ncbi:MAG TPA: hypothetical protein VLS53_02490 [Candidatus Dormibacteraeota bacterium]|nr:hypothetical protein [Candidatus Dormibacteraeota bacterium]
MTGAALHRLGQFWRHSSARVSPAEISKVQTILGSGLVGFFLELPVNDQRHGLDVLATIERTVPDPSPILRKAALLHDMGKTGAALTVLERSLTVFLGALSPRLLRAVLRLRPGLARRHAIYLDHARIGSERLRAAGAGELAMVIAEHHAPKPRSEAATALQRADHAN